MAGPYTRDDWNQIIQKVNALVQAPTSGCTALGPLEQVDAKHIWSWPNDVKAVQQLLLKVCDENHFTDHKLWQQSIIDEINAAIKNGWCNCAQGLASWLVVKTYPPAVYSNCPGYDPPGQVDLVALCQGLQLPTLPGWFATEATAGWSYNPSAFGDFGCLYHFETNVGGSYPHYISTVGNPTTPCGLNPPRTSGYTPPNGEEVNCGGPCSDAACQAALAAAQKNIIGNDPVNLIVSYQIKLGP